MARKQSFTKEKFEEKIQQDLNQFLRRNISDPRLSLVTITRVELTQDYSYADVYWDSFDASKKELISQAFDGVKGKLRSLLAKNLNVRHTPDIKFVYDSCYEDEHRIMNLIHEADE